MDSFFLYLLNPFGQQTVTDGAAGGGMDMVQMFFPFILIIAIFYFLIIRPQNKKRKETEKMHAGLKKGDRIVTIGGLYGTIQSVKDSTVIIKADDNVKLEFLRSAISSIIAPKEEKIEDKKEEKEKSAEKTSEDGE